MTFYEFVARPSTYDRRRVCEWLERHGIDPCEVPDDGWIETQPDARRVAFQAFVFEESPPMPFPVGISCVDMS